MRLVDLANKVRAFELNLTARYLANGDAGFADATERRDLQRDYADLTNGRNRLEWINDGAAEPKYFPSLYVVFLAERSPIESARIAASQLHQAFLLGADTVAREICVGKYQGVTCSSNSKTLMLSLCGLDCRTGITMEQAIAAGRANGATHHCCTNAEYAYLALRCKADGFQPQGNNLYGKDEFGNYGDVVHQYASGATKYFGRVAQGSGPLGWYHDGSPLGVWGLNGNVYEWAPGYRWFDQKPQIIPFNKAALATTDLGISSTEWQSILLDGTLVTPGTTGELYFSDTATGNDVISLPNPTWYNTNDYLTISFKNINYAAMPAIMKELAIVPHDTGEYGGDCMFARYAGERCPYRGGSWGNGGYNGVWCCVLSLGRSDSDNSLGARPAFYRAAA